MGLCWSVFADNNWCREDLTSSLKDRRIAAVVKDFGWWYAGQYAQWLGFSNNRADLTDMRQTIKILRYMPLLFCICLALVTLLALIPSTSIPKAFQFWDKAQHALAYSILSIMGCFAFPQRLRPVFFGLITHGVIIEIMQGALTSTRFGDPLDLLADGIGVLIGVIAYAFLSPKLTGTLQYSH